MSQFHVKAECPDCKGTGLYVGCDELLGAAVVCMRCEGKGWYNLKVNYKPWEGARNTRQNVIRVYQRNPGFTIRPDQPGGMSYAEWLSGKQFPRFGGEMRALVCPRWWYKGTRDHELAPDWEPCRIKGSAFVDCKEWPHKEKCWQRFDEEIAGRLVQIDSTRQQDS